MNESDGSFAFYYQRYQMEQQMRNSQISSNPQGGFDSSLTSHHASNMIVSSLNQDENDATLNTITTEEDDGTGRNWNYMNEYQTYQNQNNDVNNYNQERGIKPVIIDSNSHHHYNQSSTSTHLRIPTVSSIVSNKENHGSIANAIPRLSKTSSYGSMSHFPSLPQLTDGLSSNTKMTSQKTSQCTNNSSPDKQRNKNQRLHTDATAQTLPDTRSHNNTMNEGNLTDSIRSVSSTLKNALTNKFGQMKITLSFDQQTKTNTKTKTRASKGGKSKKKKHKKFKRTRSARGKANRKSDHLLHKESVALHETYGLPLRSLRQYWQVLWKYGGLVCSICWFISVTLFVLSLKFNSLDMSNFEYYILNIIFVLYLSKKYFEYDEPSDVSIHGWFYYCLFITIIVGVCLVLIATCAYEMDHNYSSKDVLDTIFNNNGNFDSVDVVYGLLLIIFSSLFFSVYIIIVNKIILNDFFNNDTWYKIGDSLYLVGIKSIFIIFIGLVIVGIVVGISDNKWQSFLTYDEFNGSLDDFFAYIGWIVLYCIIYFVYQLSLIVGISYIHCFALVFGLIYLIPINLIFESFFSFSIFSNWIIHDWYLIIGVLIIFIASIMVEINIINQILDIRDGFEKLCLNNRCCLTMNSVLVCCISCLTCRQNQLNNRMRRWKYYNMNRNKPCCDCYYCCSRCL